MRPDRGRRHNPQLPSRTAVLRNMRGEFFALSPPVLVLPPSLRLLPLVHRESVVVED